jgi:hypothetical protein
LDEEVGGLPPPDTRKYTYETYVNRKEIEDIIILQTRSRQIAEGK